MTDTPDLAPKPAPKKRRPKKVIPVGKNGLKKRRVMKSRSTVDDKGYMGESESFRPKTSPSSCHFASVFDDYSSYESVDEEVEAEATAKDKGKGKSSARSTKAADDADEVATSTSGNKALAREHSGSAAKPPPRGGPKAAKSTGGSSKLSGQKNLVNFFGAPVPKTKK